VIAELLHAEHLGASLQTVLPAGISLKCPELVPEDREGLVQIGVIADADFHHRARPAPGQVAQGGDLTVGNDMQHAAEIAQHRDSERHPLDRAALPGGLDHVTDAKLVFEEDKEPGDEILDQALGAERKSQAQDSAGRESGPIAMNWPAVSSPTISRISSRPALRTIWATVWPRRSAAVIVASSPSSTAAMIRRATGEPPGRRATRPPR
jgi:hypothetical protein